MRQAPSWLRWTAIVAGIVGFVMFLATPFLPIKQTQSSVHWPQNDSLNSVNAPLISVAPESIEAAIPVVATDFLHDGQTMLYGSIPPESEEATNRGLFVNYSEATGLTVASLDKVVFDLTPSEVEQLPDDAVLHLSFTGDGAEVSVTDAGGTVLDDVRADTTSLDSGDDANTLSESTEEDLSLIHI